MDTYCLVHGHFETESPLVIVRSVDFSLPRLKMHHKDQIKIPLTAYWPKHLKMPQNIKDQQIENCIMQEKNMQRTIGNKNKILNYA